MAKTTKSLVKDARLSGDLLLRILVGLLFICIGVQGLLGNTSNGLFRALDNEVLEIILGILLLICGVLLIIPSFLKGINSVYVKWSMIAILIVWVLAIIMTDFVYGLKGVNGEEWFTWLEDFVTHLLVLACVYKVSSSAFLALINVC